MGDLFPFSSIFTAETSKEVSAWSSIGIYSPGSVRSKLYLLHSPLTKSKVANLQTIGWLKFVKFILTNLIDLKSCIPPITLSGWYTGTLNWYHLIFLWLPFSVLTEVSKTSEI